MKKKSIRACPKCLSQEFRATRDLNEDVIVNGDNDFLRRPSSVTTVCAAKGPYYCNQCNEEFESLDELCEILVADVAFKIHTDPDEDPEFIRITLTSTYTVDDFIEVVITIREHFEERQSRNGEAKDIYRMNVEEYFEWSLDTACGSIKSSGAGIHAEWERIEPFWPGIKNIVKVAV